MTKLITAYIRKSNLDRFGVAASLVCAIHCSILPIITSLLPLSGLSIFEEPIVEFGFVGLSFLIALYSIVPSYLNVHHVKKPILFVCLGFISIAFGHFVAEALEIYTSTFGGLFIAYAHLVNITLLKKKVA